MTYYPEILVDSGPLVAYYSCNDKHHARVCHFFETCTSRLVTSLSCITEVMWLLSSRWQVQNQFLLAVAQRIFEPQPLIPEDFIRIAELNSQYNDLPADFADLSLVTISERLNIEAIASLDSDFDVYRRYRKNPFIQVLTTS